MWMTPTHKADLLRRRRARLQRRKVYNAKPDLPGMRKRDRRFGYRGWVSNWYGVGTCLIRRRPNQTARHWDFDVERRELKPRPPTPKRNLHRYERCRARAAMPRLLSEYE